MTDTRSCPLASLAAAIVATAVLASGCMPFSLRSLLDGEDGTALAIDPSSIVIPVGERVIFSADGGRPPYTFSIGSGGGSIDDATGEYQAPDSAGQAVVTVTDDAGKTASAEVTIRARVVEPVSLAISPASITIAATARVRFSASGGSAPYVFSVLSGGGSIDASSGEYVAPAVAGAAGVRVTDASGATADASVVIEAAGVSLAISPSAIELSASSAVTFSAIGGRPDYVFEIVTTGSGTPEINAATGYYVAGPSAGLDTVRVTDFAGTTATATVTVVALITTVDYEVPSTSLPSSGTAGADLAAGSFEIRNVGAGSGSMPVKWKLYLSGNGYYDSGDVLVTSGSISGIASGESVWVNPAGKVPEVEPGSWYLIAQAEASDDTTTANNTSSASPFTVLPRDVDYAVVSVLHTGGTVAGEVVSGALEIANAGGAGGKLTVYWEVYASGDSVPDGADFLLARGSAPALPAGASTGTFAFSGKWPFVPGTWHLVAVASAADDVGAANNFAASAAVPVSGPPPAQVNYTVVSVENTGETVAGDPGFGSFRYQNIGSDPGGQPVYWTAYLSANATLEIGTDVVLATGTAGTLAAGATSGYVSFSGAWPSPPATWYLLVGLSASDDVGSGNNLGASAAVTTVAPDVDYYPVSVTNTGAAVAGDPGSGSFAVRNGGTHAGSRTIYWTAYLSANDTLEPGIDLVIDTGSMPALDAGAVSSPATAFSGVWPRAAGSWFLIVAVSAADDRLPTNNAAASAPVATVAPPVDYAVSGVTSTGGTRAGEPLAGSFTLQNVGGHDGTMGLAWRAYVSDDGDYDAGVDRLVDSGTIAAPGLELADGPVPIAIDEGLWPVATVTRSYCLVVVATAQDDTSPSNDVGASGPISVTPPEVNYRVTSVSNTGGTVAGGPLNGSCTILNGGSDAGKRTVHWTAYLSADMLLTPGIDTVIGAGEASPLAANASTVCTFSDTWPAAAGTWYFIVDVSADDDIDSANDVTVGPAVPIAAVDYLVVSVSNPSGTTAGQPVSGNFTVLNNGAGVGASIVSWWVYASPGNTFYDAGDTIIASGSFPGLGSYGSFTPNYSGTWPSAPGSYYIVVSLVSADDAAIPTAASAMVTLDPSPTPDYTVTTVAYPSGTTTSQAVNGSFTAQNASAANGSAVVDWYVYASLGNTSLDAGDTLLASGTFPGLASWGTITPGWGGSWPAEAGTYYVLVRLVTADDGSIAVAASPPVTVSTPPSPDYTVWFNAAMPWSGLVGAAMSATGTTEITIHNTSGNQGYAAITWTVHRSTDAVLDAGDTLVQQGSVAGLAGLGSTTAAFDGPWPGAPGGLYFLIASVHAADDPVPANDVVPAPHACAVGVYRYVEVEPNNGIGPAPTPSQTNNTGVSGLAANETIAIEATMDAYDGYDTFRFVTAASMSRLAMRSSWATGYDDLDLYLWDTGSTDLYSMSVGIDSEPGAGTFQVSSVTPRTCYVSANFWLANNTSGSTGKKYVIVVTGLP